MKTAFFSLGLLLSLWVAGLAGCRDDTQEGTTPDAGGDAPSDSSQEQDILHGTCEPLTNVECLELRRGESVYHRWLTDYDTLQYDDEGTIRTVVRLADLVDIEVAADPDAWRYQIYGTDGFTFGGYATWTNIENGYIELGTRKVVFDPSQELPRSYRVRDAYLVFLSPGSS